MFKNLLEDYKRTKRTLRDKKKKKIPYLRGQLSMVGWTLKHKHELRWPAVMHEALLV